MERLVRMFLGQMDREERKDLIAQKVRKRRELTESALRTAQDMLREEQRPVGRTDLLSAMEDAIFHQAGNFDRMRTLPYAVVLVATVICRNILRDGPLYEGE